MRSVLKTCSMAFIIMLFSATRNLASAQDYRDISYQNFYDELSPYGEWIDYPEYGYVWSPRVENFRPYSTGGHWVWTDEYDWTWASDYDWGWAPFHYGRWSFDDRLGWLWIPGYEWSPAWVQWRNGGDYYGWAPLGPGINIDISFGRYSSPDFYWNFVPRQYIVSPRIYDYCVPYSNNVTIIRNTTIINNFNRRNNVFVTGPARYEVERYINRRVEPYSFRESYRPGRTFFSDRTVNVYRPRVQANNDRGFAPRRFERYNGGNSTPQRDRGVSANNNDNRGGNIFERRQQDANRSGQQQRDDQNRFGIGRTEQQNNNADNRFGVGGRTEQPNNNQDNRFGIGRRTERQNNNDEARRKMEQQQQEENRRNFEQQDQQRKVIQQQQEENRRGLERRQQEMRQQQDEQRKNMEQQRGNRFGIDRQQGQQQQQNDQQRGNGNRFGMERKIEQQNGQQQQQPQRGNDNNNSNRRFGIRKN